MKGGTVAPSLVTVAVLALAACSKGNDGKAPDTVPDAGGRVHYRPAGCAYDVESSSLRDFHDEVLDDPSAPLPGAGGAPLRVRLGLAGSTAFGEAGYADPSQSAVVIWETAAPSRHARVRFGVAGSPSTEVRTGHAWSIPAPTSGFGKGEPPTNLHEVHLCGLTPGTTYTYEAGGGPAGAEVWSAPATFITTKAQGPVEIGISGDSRDDFGVFARIQRRFEERGVALQLFSGDLTYWGTEASRMAEILDGAGLSLGKGLFLPIAGNHENEGAQFYGAFALPGQGKLQEMYGSFVAGGVHVVLLDDILASLPSSEDTSGNDDFRAQRDWLAEDLRRADADRAAHPFVVVVSHRALYTTGGHGEERDTVLVRRHFAPLFREHHVDLVVQGHEHLYERTEALVVGGDAESPAVAGPGERGTVYVVSAGAGAAPTTEELPHFLPVRAKRQLFGPGTTFDGLYSLLRVEGMTLTLTTRGLARAGSALADDPVIDTLTLTR